VAQLAAAERGEGVGVEVRLAAGSDLDEEQAMRVAIEEVGGVRRRRRPSAS
jgi:hypothetical protein